MTPNADPTTLIQLTDRAAEGDAGAALAIMRLVRSDTLSFEAEVRLVDALYDARRGFNGRRLQFALALLCARTGARARGRAILLELVAADYPPAMHLLGSDLVESGRIDAGLRLLDLARDSGYRLGDVAYWRYRAKVARGPRRGWLTLRVVAARVSPWRRRQTEEETDLAYWLPE